MAGKGLMVEATIIMVGKDLMAVTTFTIVPPIVIHLAVKDGMPLVAIIGMTTEDLQSRIPGLLYWLFWQFRLFVYREENSNDVLSLTMIYLDI